MDRAPPPTRADYPVLYDIPTRWLDNDIYGHVNNVNYYSYFDTAIANFLMGEGGLDPWRDEVVGFCVESACRFRRGIRFPDRVSAGLRVTKLGRSSVRYEIGIFAATRTRRQPTATSSTCSWTGRANDQRRFLQAFVPRSPGCWRTPSKCRRD